jgi:Cellulase (glycosyl hydrolase family 5)
MALTRREALTGAGAAWLGLRSGAASAWPLPAPPLGVRRGLDLTPNGVIRPGSPQDYRVLRAQPWAAPLIARTTHLRVWADWPALQPRPGAPRFAALDAQVDAAAADGLQVILMPYRYPRWVNGAAAASGRKAPEYRLPPDGHGPGSAWAGFVAALWRRYAGRMAAFEVVNEPNLQLWPQDGIAATVAEMILTVDAVARANGLAATCLAPSHSDAESARPSVITEHPRFADALLDELDARGFAGGSHWVWSLHHYNDVERGGHRASALRSRLAGRWRGRVAPDGGPLLYATEGGCRLAAVRRRFGDGLSPAAQRARQAELLRAALARVDAAGGVGLMTQYTVQADPRYDCGLREPDGRERPAFAAWVA